MCKKLELQEENININSRERLPIRKTGCGTREREKDDAVFNEGG